MSAQDSCTTMKPCKCKSHQQPKAAVMTRRERLRRAFFHEEMDRPAIYTRTGYAGNDPTYNELRHFMEVHTELKSGWSSRQLVEAFPVVSETVPHSQDFDRCITSMPTPKGTLRATHLVSRKGQPGLHEEYFLKSRDDAEKYLSLPMPEIGGDVSGFFARDREIGEAGIVCASPGNCPGGRVAELFGSEVFAMMSITDRDIIYALCEREASILMNVTKYVISQGVGPFFEFLGEEYIVPPLHGPRDFQDFIVKYEKPIFDLIHDAGGRVHMHCHGSIKAVISQMVEMGVDVLHPFEAPPSGDITAAEAKEAAVGRMTLEGNVQIADMYEHIPAEVSEQTRQLIGDCFYDSRGLIISPTASPYIRGEGGKCFPQYKAMVDTVLKYGS